MDVQVTQGGGGEGGRQQGRLVKLWKARSQLYRRRFLRPNTHFAAFFEIYKIHIPSHRFDTQNLQIFAIFWKISVNFPDFCKCSNLMLLKLQRKLWFYDEILSEFCRNFTEFQQFWWTRQFYTIFRLNFEKNPAIFLQKICAGSLQKYFSPRGVADIILNSPGCFSSPAHRADSGSMSWKWSHQIWGLPNLDFPVEYARKLTNVRRTVFVLTEYSNFF